MFITMRLSACEHKGIFLQFPGYFNCPEFFKVIVYFSRWLVGTAYNKCLCLIWLIQNATWKGLFTRKISFERQNFFCKADLAWKIFLTRPIYLRRFLDVLKVGVFNLLLDPIICFKLSQNEFWNNSGHFEEGISDSRPLQHLLLWLLII